MSATEQIVKVQDQVLETIESVQKPVLEAAQKLVAKAEGYVPDVTLPDGVPTLEELVSLQFGFAEKLIANQRDFADTLVATLKPVTAKLYASPKPAANKPKATKAATAA